MLCLLASSNLATSELETNPFWRKFLASFVPQFPVPNSEELQCSIEETLITLENEFRSECLLPVALIYVQKMTNNSYFFFGLGITRKINYVFLHCENSESSHVTKNNVHEFCTKVFDRAFSNYGVKIACVIVDLIEFICEEFFYEIEDIEYIITKPIHKILDSLKDASFDYNDITAEGNSPVSMYTAAVNSLTTYIKEKNSFSEVFAKLVELIANGEIKGNAKWRDAVLPFINAVTIGFLYIIPNKKKIVEDQTFWDVLDPYIDVDRKLNHFIFRMLPEGDATKYFGYYKDIRGQFSYANTQYLEKDPRKYWDKLIPYYQSLCEFCSDILLIPANPKPINIKKLFSIVSAAHFDISSQSVMFKILINLNNC